MKTGEIFLVKYFSETRVIKILKIGNKHVFYETTNVHSEFYCKRFRFLHALEKFIIGPLNKKEWYKLIRRYNENRRNIFN